MSPDTSQKPTCWAGRATTAHHCNAVCWLLLFQSGWFLHSWRFSLIQVLVVWRGLHCFLYVTVTGSWMQNYFLSEDLQVIFRMQRSSWAILSSMQWRVTSDLHGPMSHVQDHWVEEGSEFESGPFLRSPCMFSLDALLRVDRRKVFSGLVTCPGEFCLLWQNWQNLILK